MSESKSADDLLPHMDEEYFEKARKERELSPEQLEKLEELKALVAESDKPCADYIKEDASLARFLIARKCDVEKAFAMWSNCMDWRVEARADELGANKPHKLFAAISRHQIGTIEGYDKAGRPLWWFHGGCIRSKDLVSAVSQEQYLDAHIYEQEEISHRARKFARRGTWERGCTFIADCHGLGMQVRHYLPYFKAATTVDEACYPETLSKIFVINAPSIFPMIWRIVKPWLDPLTAEKVNVLGSDYQTILKEHIHEEELFVYYGGKRQPTPEFNIEKFMDEDEMKRRNDESTPDLTEYLVPARGSYQQEMEITADMFRDKQGNPTQKVSIEYYFTSVGRDIKFHVTFESEDGNVRDVIPSAKCASHKHAVWGEVTAREPGKFVFVWDNEYSYFTRKTIHYSLRVSEDDVLEGSEKALAVKDKITEGLEGDED